MTSETEVRPLLPQSFAMQTYSFAPPNLGLSDNKKSQSYLLWGLSAELANLVPDYVFVDEHNRHKRLKGRNGDL